MRFVENGPDVPDQLIQHFEDGNGVLFCGAGVSVNSGLPLFRGLVNRVYSRLGLKKQPREARELKQGNFDRVLGLLEMPDRAGPQSLRETVRHILTLNARSDVSFHKTLLELSKTIDGDYRLVTTNFDRGFAMAGESLTFEVAPALPPARKTRWHRPVHLHGLIGAEGRTLDDLVMTSADFGEAYITSGWAGRFVSGLFVRFKVLFIGYSLNDPVMRYLLDAISVAKSRGEHEGEVYAFAAAKPETTGDVQRLWRTRGVEPIIYEEDGSHSMLVRTIGEWAKLRRRGHFGRVAIVRRLASEPIPRPFAHDDRVSQVIWALGDPSGQAAREFANLQPPPSVGWLQILEESRLLELAGEERLRQGWLNPRTLPVHPISVALHEWLLHHLDKQELVGRVVAAGGFLEPRFRWVLTRRLSDPGTSLSEPYRSFWELVASSSAVPTIIDHDRTFDIVAQLKAGVRAPSLLLQAFDQLRPVCRLSRPLMAMFLSDPGTPPQDLGDLAEIDVELVAGDSTDELVGLLVDCGKSDAALRRRILFEATTHLFRAMELFQCAGEAREDYDPSLVSMPLVHDEPPPGRDTWTALVVLLRRSVIGLSDDIAFARAIFELWRPLPYPVFRRLALLSLKETQALAPTERARVLIAEARSLLWPLHVQELSVPLATDAWKALPEGEAGGLLHAILEGPPRSLHRSGTAEDFERAAEDWVSQFLTAMEATGKRLPQPAQETLENYRKRQREIALLQPAAPSPEEELRVTLSRYESLSIAEILRDVQARVASGNSCEAVVRNWSAKEAGRAQELVEVMFSAQFWDSGVWSALIEGMSGQPSIPERLSAIIRQLPPAVLGSVSPAVASWVGRTSEHQPIDSAFLDLWDTLIESVPATSSVEASDMLTWALNSPVGKLTETLLRRYFHASPRVSSGLPVQIQTRMTRVLQAVGDRHRSSRVISALYLKYLHSVDRRWAQEFLLPLLRWGHPDAAANWTAYLHDRSWYPDLLVDLKPSLLQALANRSELGGEAGKYLCQFVAGALVHFPAVVTDPELSSALQALDSDGLASLAGSFTQFLRRSEPTQRGQLWGSGVRRTFSLWPSDRTKRSATLAGRLAWLAAESGEAFPEVVHTVKHLLQPIPSQDFGRLAHRVSELRLPEDHPLELMALLVTILDPGGPPPYLGSGGDLLLRLHTANPDFVGTPDYERLASTGWFQMPHVQQ